VPQGRLSALQRDPAFCRLRVSRDGDTVLVDLVAEPVPVIEAPVDHTLGDVRVRVDTVHELLVNKLCALLSRSELRDLEDVRVLIDAGGDLHRALADAPRKDGGFSPITLAWLLEQFPLAVMSRALGWTADASTKLDEFRRRLIEQVVAAAKPD
jgi:hypothetical protein